MDLLFTLVSFERCGVVNVMDLSSALRISCWSCCSGKMEWSTIEKQTMIVEQAEVWLF